MSSKKKRTTTLTVERKMELILAVAAGDRKPKDIAEEYGISRSTLSAILKHQDKIKILSARGVKHMRRDREALYPDIEQRLMEWVNECRKLKIPVSGIDIRGKAEMFARVLGHVGFKGSNGWLEKFKRRNGVRLGTSGVAVGNTDEILPDDVSFMETDASDCDTGQCPPDTSRLWSQFETDSESANVPMIPLNDIKLEHEDQKDSSSHNPGPSSDEEYKHVDDIPVCATLSEGNTEADISKINSDTSGDDALPNDGQLGVHNKARKMISHLKEYVESFDDTRTDILEAVRKVQDFIDEKIFKSN